MKLALGRGVTFSQEIQEALGQPGCAFCRICTRTAGRYLDILAYENVNDVALRETIREGIGLCNRHAWQFVDETRALLGAAIISRDLVRTLQRRTTAAPASAPLTEKLRGLLPRKRCVACDAVVTMARDCAHQVLQSWADPSFRHAFVAGDGLCWLHLVVTLRADRLGRRWADLVAAQRAAWERRIDRALHGQTVEPLREAMSSARRMNGTQLGLLAGGELADTSRSDVVVPAAPAGHCPVCAAVGAWLDRPVEPAAKAGVRAGVAAEATGAGKEGAEGSSSSPDELPSPDVLAERGLLCAVHAWHPGLRSREETSTLLRRLRALDARLARLIAADAARSPLARWSERARRWGSLPAEVTADLTCPTCAEQLRYEIAIVRELPPATLCVPHLRLAALQSLRHAEIHAETCQTWRAVEKQLDEFIRKHDYRFQREPRGVEQDSPRWAVALVAGAEGIR